MNKKGYVLVYALAIITILMILCASLSSITYTRSNLANKNVLNIKNRTEAISHLEAAASDLSLIFNELNNGPNRYKSIEDLVNSANLSFYFKEIETTYDVTIQNVKNANCSGKYCLYTGEFKIIYNKFPASKRFFLSMIPSFFYFALGSNTDLTINGGAYIDGDIYVKNNLLLTNVTSYSRSNDSPNKKLETEASEFLTVNSNRIIYNDNNLYSCKDTCYDKTSGKFIRINEHFRIRDNAEFYSTTFSFMPPHILRFNNRFLDVDFEASFIHYLNEATRDSNTNLDLDTINAAIDEYIALNKLKRIYHINELEGSTSSVVFDNLGETVITNGFKYQDWIIVKGDLLLENKQINKISISANILVTGNITITGNFDFNSTIYALGEGKLINAAISGLDDNELLLLTKGNLTFSAINTFRNNFNDHFIYYPKEGRTNITPHIKGFFYTDSKALVNATASYIVVEGGIFANDKENHQYLPLAINEYDNLSYVEDTNSLGIVLNSYRGNVTNDFQFTPYFGFEQARLVVKHNLKILKNQPKMLPINQKFNYTFENVIIK